MHNFCLGLAKCFKSVHGTVFAITLIAVDIYLINTAVNIANFESVITAIAAVLATIITMSVIRYIGVIGMLIIVFIAAIEIAINYDKIQGYIKF